MLHESYRPGEEIEITFDADKPLRIACVVEGAAKRMSYVFCTKLADGSYAAFDVRQVSALNGVFGGVSRQTKAQLAALAGAIHQQFGTVERFHAALVGVGQKMASRPASGLH